MTDITFNDVPKFIAEIKSEQDKIVKMLSDLLSQKSTPEHEEFLNVEEAAAFLNVAVPTIYANVRDGYLPALKRRKRLYFSRKQLEQWLLTGKKKTSSDYAVEANTFLTHK